jgi:4-amino-4-deoxy-L-arabinose transferase-like glycosyltransferase
VKFGRALFLIAALALGVRVAYVALAKGGSCPVSTSDAVRGSYPGECAVGDQLFYNTEANTLADGKGFVEPLWEVSHPGEDAPPAADHPPLTVVVLTPVSWLVERPPLHWIAGDDLDANVREHRYTMAFLGVLVVVLVGLLGRRVGGDAAGLIAAVIAALSPNIWVNDGLVMSETVTSAVVVAAMLVAVALRDRPSLARVAGLGALCGLAGLARAELVLFIPLLAAPVAWWVLRSWTSVAVAVATGILVIAPWVGFNLSRFADPTFISTNDGLALAGSNCDPVYYGAGTGLTTFDTTSGCVSDPPPPGDQSQVSKAYRHRATTYVRGHLGRAPVVALARVGRTWSLFRPLDMVSYNTGEGRERWVTRLGLIVYYPTLIAAVAGAVVLWRRRARLHLWVLLAPAIAVTVGSAVTYGQTRFRAAAEPSLAVLAAVAIVAGARAVTSRSTPPSATATREAEQSRRNVSPAAT